MHDLLLIERGTQFAPSPSVGTRIALVHHSFRTVSVRRGSARQQFAAHFPALGLLSVAQSIRADAHGRQVPDMRYFDQEVFPDETRMAAAVEEWLEPAERRIIASSSYTPTADKLVQFLARFDASRYLIVVGGAHATLAPDLDNAHIVVRGEGAAAMRHIIDHFPGPGFGTGTGSAGLCYVRDGEPTTRRQVFDRSIEELPVPAFAYDLLPDQRRYGAVYATNFTRMLGTRPQVYICTQSCAARCTFCSTYLIHGRSVARPPELVAGDLDHLVHDLGHDSLEFHDDDLMQHPQLEELLDVIGATKVPWFCYARVERIDARMADRLAAAGCRRVFLGIESMRQRQLDHFNKQTTVEQNRSAVENLAAAGVGVVAGFIIGSPDDEVETVLEDLAAFLELPLLAINCSILSPDPGTAEFRRARKRPELRSALGGDHGSRIIPDLDRHGPLAPFGLPTLCRAVSKEQLNLLQTVIDASFYGRSSVWNCLVRDRTPDQVSLIRAYYDYLEHALSAVRAQDVPSAAVPVVEAAHFAMAAGPWAAVRR